MRLILIVALVYLLSCKSKTEQDFKSDTSTLQNSTTNQSNTLIDRLNGNEYELPDTICGKPISFYLNNQNVASLAKMLYRGQFRPTDNDSTAQLLSLISTTDSSIRPFYRWCLDFTITISDGALGEYPGKPALDYAIMHPKEFFDYMDKDRSGERYKKWTEIIAYSGLNDYNSPHADVKRQIIANMLSNCTACEDHFKERIQKFGNDIFNIVKSID